MVLIKIKRSICALLTDVVLCTATIMSSHFHSESNLESCQITFVSQREKRRDLFNFLCQHTIQNREEILHDTFPIFSWWNMALKSTKNRTSKVHEKHWLLELWILIITFILTAHITSINHLRYDLQIMRFLSKTKHFCNDMEYP